MKAGYGSEKSGMGSKAEGRRELIPGRRWNERERVGLERW